jgi:glycosyltransferase involved in cell wall biosynthesis
MTPTVSVIIPCFNHGQFLPEAVASVTDMKRDDVELIVVDDGSTEERTRKEMDALSASGINVLRQENKGLAAARNAGISISEGKYILPLDADNHLRPGYIEHGIRILDRNPQVGVVYGDAEYIGMRAGPWHVGPFDRNRILQWNYIDACAVYRRPIWEQNRGYDGSMPVQGLEDWDFWLGALEHGWQFEYVPEILFSYRVTNDSMITRTSGFEAPVATFIARKHSLLHRDVLLQLERDHQSLKATVQDLQRERESVRATLRNLRRLLKSRLQQKFQQHKSDGQRSRHPDRL